MRASRILPVLLVSALAAGCSSSDDRREASPGPVLAGSLQAFDACEELQAYVREHADTVVAQLGSRRMALLEGDVAAATMAAGAAATDGATAAPAVGQASYSQTNVQEVGVDEPDILKTDGRILVAVAGGMLRIVDVSGPAPVPRATMGLPEGWGDHRLLLVEDRVLVLTPGGAQVMPLEAPAAADLRGTDTATTRVTVIDVSDPGSPRTVSTVHLEGGYVDARLIDGEARVVLRSQPVLRGLTLPADGSAESIDAARVDNTAVVAASGVDDWVPSYATSGGAGGRLAGCEDVYRPEDLGVGATVTVVTIDPADPTPKGGVSVLGGGELVYANASRLYVTTSTDGTSSGIHAFDVSDPSHAAYLGSGTVPGTLLNQFSMSEHEGDLRVASTVGQTESFVTVLRRDGDRLREVGSVGGLGKGERIHAVRFLGPLGYVVTFRQVDPLYVVDLSDPAAPAVRGELKIPGYSAYLHPVGEGLLLGVGQDATSEGRALGTQVSLFDVSDPAAPARLAAAPLGRSWSEVEQDHHAFLWWPDLRRAVVPVQTETGEGLAVGFDVSPSAITETGRVSHPHPEPGRATIRRSLVVGDDLLTLSDAGLLASDLRTLARGAWLAF